MGQKDGRGSETRHGRINYRQVQKRLQVWGWTVQFFVQITWGSRGTRLTPRCLEDIGKQLGTGYAVFLLLGCFKEALLLTWMWKVVHLLSQGWSLNAPCAGVI